MAILVVKIPESLRSTLSPDKILCDKYNLPFRHLVHFLTLSEVAKRMKVSESALLNKMERSRTMHGVLWKGEVRIHPLSMVDELRKVLEKKLERQIKISEKLRKVYSDVQMN